MRLFSIVTLLLAGCGFLRYTNGELLVQRGTCSTGEYWCQDRCGSDDYGDTCCETPDGQHNLCGAGTICCMYGCCPTGTLCNAVGGCDPSESGPPTQPPPVQTMSTAKPCDMPSNITSQTIITDYHVETSFVTVTFLETCTLVTSSGILLSSSGFSSGLSSSGVEITGTQSSSVAEVSSSLQNTFPPTSWTAPDGATVVSSSSMLIINGSVTIPISSVSSATTLTTDGETFTLSPPSSSSNEGLPATIIEPDGNTIISSSGILIIGTDSVTLPTVSSKSTLTTDGETFTLLPPPESATLTSPPGLTTTLPDGQTLISSSGVLIVGSSTITIPSVTAPVTITTDGETFTFLPPPASNPTTSPEAVLTTTLPDGQTLVSSSGVLIVGSSTITIPSVTAPLTVTTDGETFTFLPPASNPSTSSEDVLTTTLPDGQTIISSSGVIIIGDSTVSIPSITAPTTLITDGETFTFSPPTLSPTTTPDVLTTTLPDGQTIISGSGVIIIGSSTFNIPSISVPTTITTDGETFTFEPSPTSTQGQGSGDFVPCIIPSVAACVPCPIAQQGCWPTTPVACVTPIIPQCTPCPLAILGCYPTGGNINPTTSSTSSILPIFTAWPSEGALIQPVADTVDDPEPSDGGGGGKSSCHMWFFFICIDTPGFKIGGWRWNLPPGIYPPGPPPIPIINLPTPWSLEGSLPPWPQITILPNGEPSYPEEPEESCETETASLCSITTSFGVSVSNGVTVTTASETPASCATILGCDVSNTAITATETGSCSVRTVTDAWVSCSSSSCSTTSLSTVTGCSVVATTTTITAHCPIATVDDNNDDGGDVPFDCNPILSCGDPACNGKMVPSPLPTPGPMCFGQANLGCPCSNPSVDIATVCIDISSIPCSGGCQGQDGSCQGAWKGCKCLQSSTSTLEVTTTQPPTTSQSTTSESTTSPPSIPSQTTSWNPPTPTGGFWLAVLIYPTGAPPTVTQVAVVPDEANDCDFFKNKYNPIGLIVIQSEDHGQSTTVDVSSGKTFTLQGLDISNYHPLCDEKGLVLSFEPAAENSDFYQFSIPGGSNPSGYCTLFPKQKSCVAIPAEGDNGAETVTNFWHCQKTDDPGYCSTAPDET